MTTLKSLGCEIRKNRRMVACGDFSWEVFLNESGLIGKAASCDRFFYKTELPETLPGNRILEKMIIGSGYADRSHA